MPLQGLKPAARPLTRPGGWGVEASAPRPRGHGHGHAGTRSHLRIRLGDGESPSSGRPERPRPFPSSHRGPGLPPAPTGLSLPLSTLHVVFRAGREWLSCYQHGSRALGNAALPLPATKAPLFPPCPSLCSSRPPTHPPPLPASLPPTAPLGCEE